MFVVYAYVVAVEKSNLDELVIKEDYLSLENEL